MGIIEFAKLIGVQTKLESSKPSTKTNREKLIGVIEKEINYLTERNTLDVEIKPNGSKRINFWRRSSDDNSLALISIKYKNKIFGFGKEGGRYAPINYITTQYSVEGVLNMLGKIKSQFEEMNDSNEMFKTL